MFLDIFLPEEVGWEILAALKAEPRTRGVPVVVVSSVDRPSRDLLVAPDDHIAKPVNRARLAAVLGRLAPMAHGAPLRRRRILLAEDDLTNATTVADFLQMRGHEVLIAPDGPRTLELARTIEPDIALVDVQMPLLDGLAVMRELRRDPDPAVRALPIVAVTALAMAGDRERCLSAGADAYLTKPVGLRHLAAVIDELLAARQT